MVTKLSFLGRWTHQEMENQLPRVLGGLCIRTIVQLDPVRAQDINLHSHPEVDAHSGDEGTSQESSILEAHQQAGLPHTGIPHQHDLEQTGVRGVRLGAEGLAHLKMLVVCLEPWGRDECSRPVGSA